MSKHSNDQPMAWRIEATERARAALNHEDLQAGVWRHLARLSEVLEQTHGGAWRGLELTVSHDRTGQKFWVVSSLREGLTLVMLRDEF